MTSEDTVERRRQDQANANLDQRHREVFGTERPPDQPAPTSPPPPTSGRGPGYDLRLKHHATCTSPRPETTGWFEQTTGRRLLNVTRCMNCAAETSQRIGP